MNFGCLSISAQRFLLAFGQQDLHTKNEKEGINMPQGLPKQLHKPKNLSLHESILKLLTET